MKEIKFRAKDIETGRLIYFQLADLRGYDIHKEDNLSVFNDGKFYTISEKTTQEFTGLKDKNGKEIYEGDVLEKYHCNIESFGELKTDGMQWWIEDKLNATYWENMDITSGEFCKIIGNIYENPELLTSNK